MENELGVSVWVSAVVVAALAKVGLMTPAARAQTGWSVNASGAAAAKKPPPPPPLQIAGSWNGTIVDPIQGAGAINLTFVEESGKAKATLKGTWIVNYNDPPNGSINDAMKGTIVVQ